MAIRSVGLGERAEWLRRRTALWPDASETEHTSEIEAFLTGASQGRPPLVAVFVSAASSGRLTGFLELSVRDDAEGCAGPTPYIEGWYVDGVARGQGLGRALVEAAEEWARRQGHTEIASDAELENRGSRRAHRALGFEEVERAVHFRKGL